MKGLKKIALVSAVAAAPFAVHADLKALDDSAMGDVTGQAGVTIELETRVDIGQFKYTDEGSFVMNGIAIGGAAYDTNGQGSVTGNLDDLQIDIDVEDDGDAVIDVHSISGAPIDYGVSIASVGLEGLASATDTGNTTLVSNLSMVGDLGKLNIRVDTFTDDLQLDLAFNVRDLDMDVDFLGVGIRNFKLMGAGYFEGGSTDTSADLAALSTLSDGDTTNDNIGLAEFNRVFASAQVTVGTAAAQDTSVTDPALQISIPSFVADLEIGETLIGGTNIGTIAIDNLAITNTNMVVYGH